VQTAIDFAHLKHLIPQNDLLPIPRPGRHSHFSVRQALDYDRRLVAGREFFENFLLLAPPEISEPRRRQFGVEHRCWMFWRATAGAISLKEAWPRTGVSGDGVSGATGATGWLETLDRRAIPRTLGYNALALNLR
jgi:hypothetical protein